MVKNDFCDDVDGFKTIDGQFFKTEKEAIAHETLCKLTTLLQWYYDNNYINTEKGDVVDFHKLVDWIRINQSVTLTLIKTLFTKETIDMWVEENYIIDKTNYE